MGGVVLLTLVLRVAFALLVEFVLIFAGGFVALSICGVRVKRSGAGIGSDVLTSILHRMETNVVIYAV